MASPTKALTVDHRSDVVVVGAGYSGIAAAWSLVAQNYSVTILEARDRVGGRAWTEKVPGGGFVDNGGQWIGPGQTAILELAREVGVNTFPTYNEGRSLLRYKGQKAEFEDIFNNNLDLPLSADDLNDFGKAYETITRLAREVPPEAPWDASRAREWDSQTFASWLTNNTSTDGAKFIFRLIIGGYFSAEPSDLSLLHLLFYIAAAGGIEGLEESSLTWRFDGGAQEIPNRLAERLGDRIHLETPVRRIDQSSTEVIVETDSGRFAGQRVIVALPPVMGARIDYCPILPASRDQYMQRAPMGSVIKIHAVYPVPFWRAKGLSGQIISENDLNVTYDNSPANAEPGILVGFLEGEPARRWADRPAEQIEQMAVEAFVDFFGEQARSPKHLYMTSWANERWSRGCYCGIPTPGTWTNYRDALRRPVGRIHWAGTETSTKWTQYLEGAVISGQRAAEEVINALKQG